MMALGMAIFFAVMSVLAWLALFPTARDCVSGGVDRLLMRLGGAFGRWQSRASGRASESSQSARAGGRRALRMLGRHRGLLLATALLLTLPPLLILLLRQQVALDGYQGGTAVVTNAHVLELLRGERLAPPPDLPPAMFSTAEVMRVAPQIVTADRKWQRLDADFQQRLLAVYRLMRERHGYEMALVEGYRSRERQARLAAQGAHVTLASAGRSWHQYGLAADSAPVRHGQLQWDMRDPWTKRGYFLYGEIAREVGLVWGGGWKSIQDYGHVELRRPGTRPPRG